MANKPTVDTKTSPKSEAENLSEELTPETLTKQKYLLWMYYQKYDRSIKDDDVLTVINEVKKIDTKPEDTVIDIILSSGGGNVYAAYKIVKLLRDKCSEMNVVIPLFAKSAATLISLAANKIYMAPQSDLGPLDFLMEHPTEEGIQISALDGVTPVEYFTGVGVSVMKKVYKWTRNDLYLGRKASLEVARGYANDCIKPILAKLDPSLVNMCYRELSIADRYGYEFLTEYMFKGDKTKKRLSKEIIKQLIWDYPSHSFAIDLKQAADLGLIVEPSCNYGDWNLIWDEFNQHSAGWYEYIKVEKIEEVKKRHAVTK